MTTDPKDAEIARLKDRLAEEMKLYAKTAAERDAALAQVAGAYEDAASIKWVSGSLGLIQMFPEMAAAIRALTPADAIAERDRRDAQMRAEGRKEGLREAAGMLKEAVEDWRSTGNSLPAQKIEDEIPAILAAAEKDT